MPNKTVEINGRHYDTRTGVLVIPARKTIDQPTGDHAISRFAPHPAAIAPQAKHSSDIGPVPHRAATQAAGRKHIVRKLPVTSTERTAVHTPARVLKNQAIDEALAKAPAHGSRRLVKARRTPSRHIRRLSVATGSLAILLLGAYFTYLNMPALSTRVAAAQAGINATYPNYHPDGYSLNGPIAYSQGQVSMRFASNGGGQNFTLAQTHSEWDSSALLEDLVQPKVGDKFTITRTGGLTVYTYDDGAAWVNGGILYTVSGNAPLSPQQVSHMATSM